MTWLNQKTKRYFLYLILAPSILLTAAAWKVQVVKVVLPEKSDKPFAVVKINKNDIIKLSYTHSNELIQVQGIFTVDSKSSLHAKETRFESSGSGLPVSFPERTSREGRWMVVDELNKEIGTLRFYIVPINQTQLFVAQNPVPVSSLKKGSLIEVKAQHMPSVKWLFYKWSII